MTEKDALLTEPPLAETRRGLLYGRRKGRPLRAAQQALVDTLLPRLEIDPGIGGAPVDPAALFAGHVEDVWLEIGFGAGENLTWHAAAYPGYGFIGCEPYLNGVARLLTTIDEGGLGNVRIYRDDARHLIGSLADRSIGRIFVLFPDPWPKLRHHKRRIVGPGTLPDFARLLRDGGELRVATDDPAYKAWILQHVLANGAFEWTARGPGDWRSRPVDWPATRYERKALAAGRTCAYFRFLRRVRQG